MDLFLAAQGNRQEKFDDELEGVLKPFNLEMKQFHQTAIRLTKSLMNVKRKRRAKKAESDAATMDPTTGKATVAEEAPGAGAGDSMVAAVAELTSTAETNRATKKSNRLILVDLSTGNRQIQLFAKEISYSCHLAINMDNLSEVLNSGLLRTFRTAFTN
ncbi:hypothetical protein Bca101_062314 [Brassica carinata]